MLLKFSKGNAKLNKTIYTFSLPAGRSCPGALDCKSMAVKNSDGSLSIKDGPKCKFRCFAASQEVLYKNTYKARKYNLELLRKAKSETNMTNLIVSSIPNRAKYVRIHVSGDFFSQTYFNAWCRAAAASQNIKFYAYTKSLNLWTRRIDNSFIPSNLILTASMGGKYDFLIDAYGLKYAKVVFSEEEANNLGLEIDHDDSLAMNENSSFALLLHGVQPKDSEAATARKKLFSLGITGYSSK